MDVPLVRSPLRTSVFKREIYFRSEIGRAKLGLRNGVKYWNSLCFRPF